MPNFLKKWLSVTPEFSFRYGENPHQKAAYYEPVIAENGVSLSQTQIQGKALSYNNINDLITHFPLFGILILQGVSGQTCLLAALL